MAPPPMQLSADPVAGDPEKQGGEYEPETVVFDIGGFADPQNPGEGKGKGIKVVIPPDLDGAAALVHVVMGMMRLTESEAKIAIVKEGIQWVDYHQNGQYLDKEGNAVHVVYFRPKHSVRIAHEPETLRPTEADVLERYKTFKLYLQEHEDDNIRDPYVQYDNWAKETGIFVAEPYFVPDGENDDLEADRRNYEKDRKAVVEYVVWERLRAKRESVASEIGIEQESAKSVVESMADQFPSMVNLDTMRAFMPAEYFLAWQRLHGRMIVAQGAAAQGKLDVFQTGDLRDKVYQLAYWFAVFAQSKFGKTSADGKVTYAGFGAADVMEIYKISQNTEVTLEQAQRLFLQYYKLTFQMMEVAGRAMAYGTEQSFLQPHEDKQLNREGQILEGQGKAASAMLDLVSAHPGAKKVNAIFYPEEETKDFRQGGEKSGGDDWSEGMNIELFLWYDADAGEWVLDDFSQLDDKKENRAAGKADAPVPAALFEALNSKLRFPKGALFYRVPGEGSYRILRTTARVSPGEWLREVAIAGLVVGLAVATMGASIPAQVVMIGSAVAMAGAEVSDMTDEAKQGMLSTERILLHSALIASCVLGSTSGGLSLLEQAGMASVAAGKVAQVVAGLQVGADGVCVAVFTHEAFEGLKAAAEDTEGMTFKRLLGFFLQMGMNGLMLYGMHGAGKKAAGVEGGFEHGANLEGPESRTSKEELTVGKNQEQRLGSLSYYDETNFDAFARMPEKRMNAWIRYLQSFGVQFEIGTESANLALKGGLRGLLLMKCINGETNETLLTIFLQENPAIGVFYEECYHALQHIHDVVRFDDVVRHGKTFELVDMWEYGAKTRILHEATKTGLSYEEYIFIERQIEDVLNGSY